MLIRSLENRPYPRKQSLNIFVRQRRSCFCATHPALSTPDFTTSHEILSVLSLPPESSRFSARNPKPTKKNNNNKKQCEQSKLSSVHTNPDCVLSLLRASGCAVTLRLHHRACRSQVWVRGNPPRRNIIGLLDLILFFWVSECVLIQGLFGSLLVLVRGEFVWWVNRRRAVGRRRGIEERARRVDLLWMVCLQAKNRVAEITFAGGVEEGCGFLGRESVGDRPCDRCVLVFDHSFIGCLLRICFTSLPSRRPWVWVFLKRVAVFCLCGRQLPRRVSGLYRK